MNFHLKLVITFLSVFLISIAFKSRKNSSTLVEQHRSRNLQELVKSGDAILVNHIVVNESNLSFEAWNENFNLELQPDNVFHPSYNTSLKSCMYKAIFKNDQSSLGLLYTCDNQFKLTMLHQKNETRRFSIDGSIAYQHQVMENINQLPPTLCGLNLLTKTESYKSVGINMVGSALKTVRMVVFNDAARITSFNGNIGSAEGDSASLVSLVNSYYSLFHSEGYSIQVQLSGQRSFTTNPWPLTRLSNGEIQSTNLLNSANNWKQGQNLPVNDGIFLFSGENFEGGHVGVSGVGGICHNNNLAVVQTSGFYFNAYAKIATHELGHLLNMQHDDTSGCTTSRNTFMWSVISLDPGTFWSTCSQTSFANMIDSSNALCLDSSSSPPPPKRTSSPRNKNPTKRPTRRKRRVIG
jgi:hypothetical protein